MCEKKREKQRTTEAPGAPDDSLLARWTMSNTTNYCAFHSCTRNLYYLYYIHYKTHTFQKSPAPLLLFTHTFHSYHSHGLGLALDLFVN